MPKSTAVVEMRKRCFCSFKVGNVEVELFTEELDGDAARVRITSSKKISALRCFQELSGFVDAPSTEARRSTVPLKKAVSG